MKIISLLISISFLSNTLLYSHPISEDSLRLPVAQKKTHNRIKGVIRSAGVDDYNIQPGYRIEIGGERFKIIQRIEYLIYKAKDINRNKLVVLKFPQDKSEDRDKKEGKSSRYEQDFFTYVPPHDNIVRGYSLEDESGNILIVTSFIEGEILLNYIDDLTINHKVYYEELLVGVLERFVGAIKGGEHVLRHGFYHECSAYHILIDTETGRYMLFDFNLPPDSVNLQTSQEMEADMIRLFGDSLGDLVAKGPRDDFTLYESELIQDKDLDKYGNVINLKKIYPYISGELNEILMRFTKNSSNPYTSLAELRSDIESVVARFKSEKTSEFKVIDGDKIHENSQTARSAI